MPPFRWLRARWRGALPGMCIGLVAGCATRYPAALAPLAPISATNIWRIEEGDLLKTRVFRNAELNAEPTVGPNGTAFFPGLGRLHVVGISVDSLETLLNARYATLVREPAVQVTMQREVTLYGQVRTPGVYAVDPGTTLLALSARAGGQTGYNGNAGSGTLSVRLETADGRRLLLPREARLGTIDLHRSDAINLVEESFFTRNATTIQASSLVVSTLTALISLILIVSR